MKSPFPGMDPYLEASSVWRDFHYVFVQCWREAIQARLPRGYDARVNERVCIVEPGEPLRRIGPDVFVSAATTPTESTAGSEHATDGATAATALVEPVSVPLVMDLDKVREPFIEIQLVPGR